MAGGREPRPGAGAPPRGRGGGGRLNRLPAYALLCLILFWIPSAILLAVHWRVLPPARRRAFWRVLVLMAGVTFGMEWVYLKLDIWSFSEERFPLLGIKLGFAPVEEFLFWFGATPFCLLVYTSWERWAPRGWLRQPARMRRG